MQTHASGHDNMFYILRILTILNCDKLVQLTGKYINVWLHLRDKIKHKTNVGKLQSFPNK